MSNDFLDNLEREGADPFKGLETETPSESLTEKEPEKEKPEEGKVETPVAEPVPFHKDPRWIKREQEAESLRATNERIERELGELRRSRETPSDVQVPEWFTKLYGENTEAWKAYSAREQQQQQEITQRVIQHQQQQQQAQQAEATRWNKWVDDEIAALQADGKTFDRNKLLKVMVDFGPTTNDSFDFKKGYAIYEKLEGGTTEEKSQARKELADSMTKTSAGAPKTKGALSAAELRGRSWQSLSID